MMAVCREPTKSTALNKNSVAVTYKTALPHNASHPKGDAGHVSSTINRETKPTTAVALNNI